MFLFNLFKKTKESSTGVPIMRDTHAPIIDESRMTGIRLSKPDLDFIVGEFKHSILEKNVPDDYSLFKDRFLYKDYIIVFRYTTGMEMPSKRPFTSVLWNAFRYADESKWDKMQSLPYVRGCTARTESDRLGKSTVYENEQCPSYYDVECPCYEGPQCLPCVDVKRHPYRHDGKT